MENKYKVGDVIRFGAYAFADATIVYVADDGTFDVARPYTYASEFSRGPLTGIELVRGLPANSTFEVIDEGRTR